MKTFPFLLKKMDEMKRQSPFQFTLAMFFGVFTLLAIAIPIQVGTPQISKTNARQVKPGMSAAQVEAILGQPRDVSDNLPFYLLAAGSPRTRRLTKHWVSNYAHITVRFDTDNRVKSVD